MFDVLNKYKQNGHFFLTPGDELSKVCNAPEKQPGVFLAYALKNGRIELVFIGGTGEIDKRRLLAIQNTGVGGLKDELLNGLEFTDTPRKISWPAQMEKEHIEALDIYWYVTYNEKHSDNPEKIENTLFEIHFGLFQRIPRWNLDL
ncbi:hypothetical protein HDF26_004711 [Pedobacter cryoconitis]|uniref:hypothetical protein n=1 Tax=Pedobacter cryoconitis TaxID=188932 RepID=UPI001618D24B|nr:hypothetical protein [Pedobacter cryoconitis]MBB6274237.1 hypothetical protein [Pedobacter cryoconitis]